ncbi:MAG TPA: thiamine phosphate synthase [Acidiferrobacteraceae bacterium]|nr:thiamine phosphate synthase [Acidiferrobacteraceae bacterium]
MTTPITGLYAIADTQLIDSETLTEKVAQAIAGGARLIQYRDKTHHSTQRQHQAQQLKTLCQQHGVPLIINDNIELAKKIRASGVHLGRDDDDIKLARKTLGKDAIIGISCYNDLARAIEAEKGGADYVAFGRFFDSPTKPNAIQAESGLLKQAKTTLTIPIVAIGGISSENGGYLIDAGANSLAVISGVFAATNVYAAAWAYSKLFSH